MAQTKMKGSFRLQIDPEEVLKLAGNVRLTVKQARAIVRRGLQAGSTPMLKAYRNKVKAHETEDTTGLLASAVGRRVNTSRRTGRSYVRIGALREVRDPQQPDNEFKPSRYLHLLEFGTDPHLQGIALSGSGEIVGTRPEGEYMHPGSRPVPLLRQSYDQTRDEVSKRTIEYCQRNLLSTLTRKAAKMEARLAEGGE